MLLTAYADTQAAIASINTIGLDYYLMKPWDHRNNTSIRCWTTFWGIGCKSAPPIFDGIRVAGTLWSPKSHEVKDFLARNRIPYLWQDIEQDSEAQTWWMREQGRHRLPVVFFPDGSTLVEPDNLSLAGWACAHRQPCPSTTSLSSAPGRRD